MSSNGLVGRNAVITGGSRGIGAAVARQLHAAGAEIIIASRTANQLEEVAASLSGRVQTTTCDVSNADSVAALASFASDRLERIDILVNNAGVASSAPLHHQTLEEWERLFAVNVRGTFLCTQAFVPAMVKRSWGRVVNIASLAARTGAPYISAYAASKHAVLGFTRSIAAEVAERGVTVNALCPGYVDTDMTVDTVERIMCKTGMSREEALASILQSTPQRRLITADEVAYMAICLCDEQARGINGQAIGLDGGEFLG